MARSTYYYALRHPPRPTRPELWGKAVEVFNRTANGCGHRQIAMCLRAEEGARIADKTVLKMMREIGDSLRHPPRDRLPQVQLLQGRRREDLRERAGRDFAADGPVEKMGTDVTEFRQPWGKAYFAPAFDFGSCEIAAWSISRHPDMAQQKEMLGMLLPKIPEGKNPIMHSDMGGSTSTRRTAPPCARRGSSRACRERGTASTTGRRSSCSAT